MIRSVAVAATIGVLTAACGSGSSPDGRSTARTVTVFAAASLTDAFRAEAAAYRRATGGHVTLSFAGSQDLVAQLREGAPADALATADEATMREAAARLSSPARTFARNRLVVVVPRGNPQHVRSLTDLARPGLVVVLAAPTVPAGDYAATALAAAHVTVHPRSLEDNVRGVLTKVELGEADAGIVYATDARSAQGRIGTVPITDSPVATYPIAPLDPRGAAFVRFVLSPAGQAVLRHYGFLPP